MTGGGAGAGLVAGLLAGLAVLCCCAAPAWGVRLRLRGAAVDGGPRRRPDLGDGGPAARGPAALDDHPAPTVPEPPARWARVAAVGGTGCLGAALAGAVGGAVGLAAGAVLQQRLASGAARAERWRRARLRADLPWAADLLAACLAAGAPPAEAAEVVAGAVGGPVADALRRAVAMLRLGGDPASCWAGLSADPELAGIGRALARSAESGTPPAPVISAEAALCRADGRLAAQAAVARVGVLAAAPLGLCFLPAFLLIGIVPVVVGLGSDILA